MIRSKIKFAWLPKIINTFNSRKIVWLRKYREYQVFQNHIEYNHWGVPNFTPHHGWKVFKRELI